MTIDIAKIRAAAEAAPKDAWRYEPYTQKVWSDKDYMVASIRGWGHLQYLPNGVAVQDATGVHIATSNPSTVIAMCDEIEALRADAARYRYLFTGDKVYSRFLEVYNFWDGLDGKVGFDDAIDAAMRGDL